MRFWSRPLRWAALASVLCAATLAVAAYPRAQAQEDAPIAATPEVVARGRYLTALGDCQACHTREGGAPFAGGRPLATPFGVILSANITSDASGIGGWTPAQFYRAMHEGVDAQGRHLYPAFPYNYYTQMPRADVDAIFVYLKTLPAVKTSFDRNQLAFPFNIRALMAVWNPLFLRKGPYQADPAKSAEWNRGAYLVTGPGHCGACHTPQNPLGAPKRGKDLRGGAFESWFAPDLTSNARTGLGGWTRAELLEFLSTGRNGHAQAFGEMGEVIANSTSQMTPQDLNAVATYLSDLPASPTPKARAPDPAVLRQGEAIWQDACSACHGMSGEGEPRYFPPLRRNANLQQDDPTTLIHLVLGGVRTTQTEAVPTGLGMPSFAWKLDDAQTAAVLTYVRNSWGNQARSVRPQEVAKLRRRLALTPGEPARAPPADLRHPNPGTFAPAGSDSRDNGTVNAGRTAP